MELMIQNKSGLSLSKIIKKWAKARRLLLLTIRWLKPTACPDPSGAKDSFYKAYFLLSLQSYELIPSIKATAWAEIPSPLPSKPKVSVVVAFTEI